MSENYKKSIIIVEDHPMLQEGMAQILKSEHALEIVEQFNCAEDLLKKIHKITFDLAIIDISLPGMNGLELVKNIISRFPDLKILMFTRHDESLYAYRAIQAGVSGYLMKNEAGRNIIHAVKKILDGGIYVSPSIKEQMLLNMAGKRTGSYASPIHTLSDRELEVFEWIGKGYTAEEIASKLHIATKTIHSYRSRIKSKLNLNSANELIRHAVKWVEIEKDLEF